MRGTDLDIRYVNPLGGTEIFDFSYYKTNEWMSQGLIDALTAWELLVTTNQPIYAANLATLEQNNNNMQVLLGQLSDMNSSLAAMLDTRTAILAEVPPGDTTAIDAQILAQRTLIAGQNVDIQNMQISINSVEESLRYIVHLLYFTSKLSFDNFEQDIETIISSSEDASTNWQLDYNADSPYPGFNVTLLITLTPEIESLIFTITNQITNLQILLKNGYTSYPPQVSDLVTLSADITSIINNLYSLYSDFQSLIPATVETTAIANIIGILESYLTIIYYPSNMSYDQYLELTNYIYENTYTNSNIVITDIMTPADIQAQAQSLYDQSKQVLVKASHPRFQFTGNFSNFLALQNFSSFANELEMGGVIYIQKSEDVLIEAVLLEITIDYSNPTDFAMTFGNNYRLDNSRFIYGDFLGAAAQLGSNLS